MMNKIDKSKLNKKVGPNKLCWCNSGKKFKKCHGKIMEDLRREEFMREKYDDAN